MDFGIFYNPRFKPWAMKIKNASQPFQRFLGFIKNYKWIYMDSTLLDFFTKNNNPVKVITNKIAVN